MATPALDLHLPVRIDDASPLMLSPDFADVVRAESRRPSVNDGLGGWHAGEVNIETLFVPVSKADEFIGALFHRGALSPDRFRSKISEH